MATVEQFAGRLTAVSNNAEPAYRTPPHNIEAEQALLGAILVNNDAFDRVSDFLRSEHFIEEIHRRIFEIAGSLIRAGKLASPITLKTFLGEHDVGGGAPCRNIWRASPPRRRPSSTPMTTAAPSMIWRSAAN